MKLLRYNADLFAKAVSIEDLYVKANLHETFIEGIETSIYHSFGKYWTSQSTHTWLIYPSERVPCWQSKSGKLRRLGAPLKFEIKSHVPTPMENSVVNALDFNLSSRSRHRRSKQLSLCSSILAVTIVSRNFGIAAQTSGNSLVLPEFIQKHCHVCHDPLHITIGCSMILREVHVNDETLRA